MRLGTGRTSTSLIECESAGDAETLAHLLKFLILFTAAGIEILLEIIRPQVSGKHISASACSTPEEIPWSLPRWEGFFVIEATGEFRTRNIVAAFLRNTQKGNRRCVCKGRRRPQYCHGRERSSSYDLAAHDIVTAASCTTNCPAPVVKVIHENIGTAARQYYNDPANEPIRKIAAVDGHYASPPRSFALHHSSRTTTGSATGYNPDLPRSQAKLSGHAVRIPPQRVAYRLRLRSRESPSSMRLTPSFGRHGAGAKWYLSVWKTVPLFQSITRMIPCPLSSTAVNNGD